MIANPKWFGRRSYGGWGFVPVTWQGWAYLVALFVFLMATPFLPISGDAKVGVQLVFAVIFSLDTINIMLKLRRDERDIAHEALAERNAAWTMVVTLVIGLSYQAASQTVPMVSGVDIFLLSTLLLGALAKSVTNFYLRNK